MYKPQFDVRRTSPSTVSQCGETRSRRALAAKLAVAVVGITATISLADPPPCQHCQIGVLRRHFQYVLPSIDYTTPSATPSNPCELTQYIERTPANDPTQWKWAVQPGSHIKSDRVPSKNIPATFDPVAYATTLALGVDFDSISWPEIYNDTCDFLPGDESIDNACEPETGSILWPTRASRSNLLLSRFPSLGDFLPSAPTLGESSLPLIANQDSALGTGWQGAPRPVLGRSVDLITGMPLVQVTDLELPFGTSKFRLTRTRSGTHSYSDPHPQNLGTNCGADIEDAWWDWLGPGWMAGENPLLLIDAAWPDIVGGDASAATLEAYPRGNWLVLDAHHSIPFQQVNLPPADEEEEPRVAYEAPPRFRARMEHNGTWGIVNGPHGQQYGWKVRPTHFDVWLNEGAVHYVFVANWHDVPVKDYNYDDGAQTHELVTSLNERTVWEGPNTTTDPFATTQPGYGVPYMGLCVRIEDRHQNRADIFYAPTIRHTTDLDSENDCIECMQLGLRKGQINHIELSSIDAEGDRQIDWTLVYAHRFMYAPGTESQTPNWGPLTHPVFESDIWYGSDLRRRNDVRTMTGSVAMDHIFVYKGIVESLNEADPATLEPIEIYTEAPMDFVSSPQPPSGLPSTWTYRVHYRYQSRFASQPDPSVATPHYPLRLIWTEVTRHEEGLPDQRSHTFFRYLDDSDPDNVFWKANLQPLERIYTDSDFANLKTWRDRILATDVTDPDLIPDSHSELADALRDITPMEFALARTNAGFTGSPFLEPEKVISPPPTDPEEQQEVLESFSSIRFGRREMYDPAVLDVPPTPFDPGWPTTARHYAPHPEVIRDHYLNAFGGDDTPFEALYLDNSRVLEGAGQEYLGAQQAGLLSIRASESESHHWRIFRLVLQPKGIPLSGEHFHYRGGNYDQSSGEESLDPDASVFAHPYRWRTFQTLETIGDQDKEKYVATPELHIPRWVVILDEFSDRQSMVDPAQIYGQDSDYSAMSAEYGTKKGQISRRVVELNPAGFILRDKTWEFKDGTVTVSGGGLGDQFEYRRIEELFSETELDPLLDLIEVDDLHTKLYGTDPEKTANKQKQLQAFTRELLLTEHRSVGWSAAELADPQTHETQGLITFREYKLFGNGASTPLSEIPLRSRVQMVATGVQNGSRTDGEGNPSHPYNYTAAVPEFRRYTKQWFYDDECPTNLVCEVEHLTNTSGGSPLQSPPNRQVFETPAAPTMRATWTEVHRETGGSDDTPKTEARILYTKVVQSPRQLWPGSDWFYPVALHVPDGDKGLGTWSIAGLVLDPDNPAPVGSGDEHQSLFFNYTRYSLAGTVFEAVDIDVDVVDPEDPIVVQATKADTSFNVYKNALPSGWTERIGDSDPLSYVTYYEYWWDHIPWDIYYPNGRRFARRIFHVVTGGNHEPPATYGGAWTTLGPTDEEFVREYTFNDLELSGGTWLPRSPGQIRDFKADDFKAVKGQTSAYEPSPAEAFSKLIPTKSRRVHFATPDDPIDVTAFLNAGSQPTQPFFIPIAEQRFLPDQYGRLTACELFDRNVDGAMAPMGFKQINDLGEVHRTRDFDGTITRIIKNSIGQALRKYVGTNDVEWTQSGGSTIPAPGGSGVENNLVLVERTEWGSGVTNAWMPTITRRYTTNTGLPNDWHLSPWTEPPAADPDGQATITRYDWRMRPVRVEVYEAGDPFATSDPAACLSTTLTYLDNANRVAMTAVYAQGATIPSNRDPATFAPNTTLPTADLILGESVKPISLTETIYAADGSAIERRDYDVTSASSYRSTFTYSGLGGQTTFQLSGESCQTSRLDSLGRVISSSTIAPRTDSGKLAFDLEVARTDNFYDADSNLKRIVRWERVTPWTAGNDLKVVPANAVWSTTVNWYDANKRLIATGDVGAGNGAENITVSAPTSTFTSSSTAAMAAPTWFDDDGTIGSAPTISTTTGVVNRDGDGDPVPVGVPLTIYHFDSKGRNDLTATPRAVIPSGGGGSSNDYDLVKYEYTGLGKLARKTENPFPASGEQSRTTSYEYRFGQVSRVIVDSDPSTTDPDQWTALEFGANDINRHGADVIDLTLADGDGGGGTSPKDGALSKSASAVRAMYLLATAPPTGTPINADEHLFFRYDFLGRLAERVDKRGVAMRYRYDALDRLKSIEVGTYANTNHTGTFTPGYPSSMSSPGGSGAPADMIGFVEFKYAEDGIPLTAGSTALGTETFEVRAYTERDGSLIAFNRMEVDKRHNLLADIQMLGDDNLSASDIPKTTYSWNYLATTINGSGEVTVAGRNRLGTMAYPDPSGSWAARSVLFTYGTTGSVDDALSRITGISTTPSALTVASFEHIGSHRRSAFTLGNSVVAQNFDKATPSGSGPIGLNSLDCFGRTQSIDYRAGTITGTAMLKLTYAYDQAGSRLQENRYPQPGGGTGTNREQLNDYDEFGRLSESDLDNVTSGGTHTDYFANQWSLDALGNWLELQTTLGANNATQNREHDYLNQIDTSQNVGGPTITPVYDEAGNLRYDGQFVYQYDAWNRLCQVTLPQANAPPGTPGTLVKHFLYDGLGRLIRVQSPYPDPATGESTDEVRSERIFYDGVRRVQEYVTDPLPDTSFAAQQGNAPAQEALASQASANHNSTNSGTETSLLRGAGAGGGGGGGGLPPGVSLAREYIWGPGDRGLDELLCQFGPDRSPTYALHDGGGDIIALADKNGAGSTPRLVWQSTYDAYGQVIEAQTLHAHPPFHAGHKGLFFDRLDAGIVDPITFNETPRLMPAGHAGSTGTARIIGYARNRHLHTGFGRWLQRDPNDAGAAVLSQQAMHGSGVSPWVPIFNIHNNYADGANVYQYARGTGYGGHDPLGLFYSGWTGDLIGNSHQFDPFDMVDDFLAEDVGSKAAFFERLLGAAHAASYVTTSILSHVPGPVGMIAGIANEMMGVPSALEGTNLLIALKTAERMSLGVNLGRMTGKIAGSAIKAGMHYASRHGSRAAPGAVGGAGIITAMRKGWPDGNHHLIPIYMGGKPGNAGATIWLTGAKHRELHSLIDGIGWHRYGIPMRHEGRAEVASWLANTPGGGIKMRMALIEAYERFDGNYGTNFSAEFYQEMIRQKWLLPD